MMKPVVTTLPISNNRKKSIREVALSKGFRSGLEDTTSEYLKSLRIKFKYEPYRFLYKPQRQFKQYTPDFELPNGIIVETKGLFESADRTKHRDIKAMYPALDVRFVFARPLTRLSKTSKTTYASWCDHYGFLWAAQKIPLEWLNEPHSPARFEAIEAAKSGVPLV